MLRLQNTLTRKKENFKPIRKQEVRMYTCGPTVYDVAHIGNLRTYVFEDVLRRSLEFLGYKVTQVMNITDVEDKIINKAKEQKKRIGEVTKVYTKKFFEDIKSLNIEEVEVYPLATAHVKEIVELIQSLMKKGFAYQGDDGSIYFDISKFKKYGKLVGLGKIAIKDGARVSADEYSKDNVRDFVLWKTKKKGEPSWRSPFGGGRPGWHIECSAMSMRYLGKSFDIHTGGVDNIFPHHENEIAQSEAATGKKFVNYWLHGEHLLVGGERMAKSAKNFFTLDDVEKRGYMPLAFRYFVLGAHYRSKLNFTWTALESAQSGLWNLWRELGRLKFLSEHDKFKNNRELVGKLEALFKAAVEDDLNIPGSMAALRRVMSDPDISPSEKRRLIFKMDKVLGLDLAYADVLSKIPVHIKALVVGRELLRRNQQFVKADTLRHKVESLGYEVEDTSYGPFIWPNYNRKSHHKT
ncbi:MAG: cysteine--tRNA ligase [Candidatus Colwellbacteria bacterium GWA2_46_10]|uniref:Cysteine--tRNA ligase n=1 Tax=Candidatus Colwellbacteria bacterium GWA2_46_10 TaxID=1797684 RepID=A0A1G1YWD6_9BACT|nr:MAG: Cysteine-tRNA ligase [Parcubacteria group bacterium GW2011_GWA2_46_10]OGY56539.1 MAG: cysteine--tRNA ligase [Candidatus Colwellbacteria bacterium GWA2_46_10]